MTSVLIRREEDTQRVTGTTAMTEAEIRVMQL